MWIPYTSTFDRARNKVVALIPHYSRKTNSMNCFAHPETNAVAQCYRCRKGICTACTKSTDGATLCFSCYESLLRAEIAQAKRSTVGVWIFTGAVTLFAAITSVANNAGGAIILVIPLAFALSWCLFWGWMQVWKGFTRTVGGCIIGPAILLLFGFVLLVGIAILVGAVTGIQRYNDARRLVTDGDQMLAGLTLRHTDVHRISENQVRTKGSITWE
jgi:hypothetical protein